MNTQWEYAIVLALVLFFPLVLSFAMRLDIYRHRGALAGAIGIVSVIYWIWDIAVTARGHWTFNQLYVLGAELFGLPLEEWLFFVVIAFVSIFTYEAVRATLRGRR